MSAQRRHARKIARLLAPAAARGGGFASAEARVRARPGLDLRPDVCVARGDPPYDGVLTRAPVLVVVVGPPAGAAPWLTLGVEAVWSLTGGGAWLHLASGGVAAVPATGWLTVPGWAGLELRVGDMLPPAATLAPPAGARADPAPPAEAAVPATAAPGPALRPARVLR